jgi:hypothetical protein
VASNTAQAGEVHAVGPEQPAPPLEPIEDTAAQRTPVELLHETLHHVPERGAPLGLEGQREREHRAAARALAE